MTIAKLAGAKLRRAGFGFHITADPLDRHPQPGDSNGPFMAVWRVEEATDTEEQAVKKFIADLRALFAGWAGASNPDFDNFGSVPPNFVPSHIYKNGEHFRFELQRRDARGDDGGAVEKHLARLMERRDCLIDEICLVKNEIKIAKALVNQQRGAARQAAAHHHRLGSALAGFCSPRRGQAATRSGWRSAGRSQGGAGSAHGGGSLRSVP